MYALRANFPDALQQLLGLCFFRMKAWFGLIVRKASPNSLCDKKVSEMWFILPNTLRMGKMIKYFL